MNWWLYCLPFIGACLGWGLVTLALRFIFQPYLPKKILGISIQGIIPKRQKAIAAAAGALSASFLSVKELEEKITHPDNIKKIMPQVEEHIDNFLRVKLVKSMPVVGMFVGDKTISNLKSLFITELEELFPEIMTSYLGRLQEEFDLEKIVSAKIIAYSPATLQKLFTPMFKRELRVVKLLGILLGFIIGLIQVLITFITIK